MTRTAVTLGAGLLALPVIVAVLVAGLLTTILTGGPSAASALIDIPRDYLALYQQAATDCPELDWTLLAAIGKIESDHGRSTAPGVTHGQNPAGAAVICGSSTAARHVRIGATRHVSVTYPLVVRHVTVRCAVVIMKLRAERAVSPSDGSVSWVVIDDAAALHPAGCAFLAGLRGRDRSVNTERLYAGRVALFLSWCAADGVVWERARLDQMVRFKRWLVSEPLPSPTCDRGGSRARYRAPGTADAILGTVCEFLRFCARHELADRHAVDRLHEVRSMRFLPPGYQAGEDDRFRTVRSRLLSFTVAQTPFAFVEPDRLAALVAAARNPRDRFLVTLLGMTGLRIGEALGLHRGDMHLLADSRVLGCPTPGPHLHVRRRPDNPNGALAKSRFPRTIPVPAEAVGFYADYLHDRALRLGTDDANPLVFVTLYRPPTGRAWRYGAAKEMFDRLARRSGVTVRPHLLRHTAATTWLRQGTPRDTVQHLLGHVSPVSMQPYLHPDPGELRAAVERGAAWAGEAR